MGNETSVTYPPIRSARQVGHTIKRIRKSMGLTQMELAQLAGLRQAGISQLESGASGVRLGSLFKILSAIEFEFVVRARTNKYSEG